MVLNYVKEIKRFNTCYRLIYALQISSAESDRPTIYLQLILNILLFYIQQCEITLTSWLHNIITRHGNPIKSKPAVIQCACV